MPPENRAAPRARMNLGPVFFKRTPLIIPPAAYPIIVIVKVMDRVWALQSGKVAAIDLEMIVQV